jgi:Berberine and berberine like
LLMPPLQDRYVLYRLGEKESSLPGNVIAMYDIKNVLNFAWTGRSDMDVEGGGIFLRQLARSLLANATVQCSTVPWTRMYESDQFVKKNSDVFDWSRSVYGAACWTGFLMNNTPEFWDVVSDVFAAIFAQTKYVVPDVEMWGGAIRTNPARTSFGYRNATFNVGLLLMVPVIENAEAVFLQESAIVNAAWPKVEAFLEGSYVNYPSAYLLEHADYARVLWGKKLEALVSAKQKYDPHNIFRQPMSIPVSM